MFRCHICGGPCTPRRTHVRCDRCKQLARAELWECCGSILPHGCECDEDAGLPMTDGSYEGYDE